MSLEGQRRNSRCAYVVTQVYKDLGGSVVCSNTVGIEPT